MKRTPQRITVRKIAHGQPGFYVCIGGLPVKETVGSFRSNKEFGRKPTAQKFANELRGSQLSASQIKSLVGYPQRR